ncbi:MAG TPA: ABC transporter ATP-binding protein [Steroidobacteraceae bacterium]|nr:ABC transporter ATP-binding protein [Steroidobacteraceae bacterium]
MHSTRASAEPPHPAAEVLGLEAVGVAFTTPEGVVSAVREASLTVARGECLGVVGESGAGKSQLFLAVMGLLAANGRARGSARFLGRELFGLGARALDRVRGAGIGMVFQDPMTALTPHLTVGAQIAEVLRRHRGLGRAAARERALALLERVHLSAPAVRLGQYPHELSGGMRQRVMIAIALGCEPQLLILDEPTSSLDVTIQAQILALLAELKRERAMAMVLITHDLAAVAGVADRVAVMQAGRVIETGAVAEILGAPREPYTRALVSAARPPRAQSRAAVSTGAAPLLALESIGVEFPVAHGWFAPRARLRALSAVSLELAPGEALAVVGESGCGKSTLARAVLALLRPCAGRVLWLGSTLAELPPRELRLARAGLQMIFQDPLGSLDPRMTVAEIVAEPLRVHAPGLDAAARARASAAMLERVGLAAELFGRYPHELSGGQCQRVGIARAMILKPRLLVCDEPVSALDLPTQRQILELLATLRREEGLSLLFVSHNLALVRQLCERVLVLYLGRTMELAPTELLFRKPLHPYTRELLAAEPIPDPVLQPARLAGVVAGEPPSPLSPPSGCVYRTRCPHAIAVCAERVPGWDAPEAGRRVACHRWGELGSPAMLLSFPA